MEMTTAATNSRSGKCRGSTATRISKVFLKKTTPGEVIVTRRAFVFGLARNGYRDRCEFWFRGGGRDLDRELDRDRHGWSSW
jgi:hypothetical protein